MISFRNKLVKTVAAVQVITVRHAKVVKRPEKFDFEYTNAAAWRRERTGYSNPNRHGPLTNLQDYSYLDGRPVPLGVNLKKRMETQQKYAESITRLSAEIDFARERYKTKMLEMEQNKQRIIDNKLKKKGSTPRDRSNTRKPV